ncbi:unnamed protein product [Prunus brigantina]
MDQFVYKLIKSKIKTVHNSEDELPIAQEVKEATNLKDNSSVDELVASLVKKRLKKCNISMQLLTETLGLNPAVPLVGPRICCLGKEFAYREMKIFCAVLLGSHKFKLSDENTVAYYWTKLTLHIDGGLHVLASPRFGHA